MMKSLQKYTLDNWRMTSLARDGWAKHSAWVIDAAGWLVLQQCLAAFISQSRVSIERDPRQLTEKWA